MIRKRVKRFSLATALADRYHYSDFEALAFDAGAFFLNFKE